ncbi:hypothetical protein DFQ27_001001 [Actinomortierella ambigua]|uniref:Uncharacterized protein n=1 Tax=Actinomortierella ambigua TaxID=1343610 RepID=A0A9P6UD56_9FUNG|nr:hypothetical protein DFQ27_001001 [Actinomortierella ambigua]
MLLACAQGIEDISYFGYNGYKAKVTYICSPDTGIAKLQVNLIDQRVENKSWSGTLDTTCDGLPQEEVEVTLDATPTPLKDESGKADLFVELLFLKSDNSEVKD